MKIKLDDKYCITADEHQYKLQELVVNQGIKNPKNKGKEHLRTVSYNHTITECLKNWCNTTLRMSDCESIKDIHDLIKEQNKTIEKLFPKGMSEYVRL